MKAELKALLRVVLFALLGLITATVSAQVPTITSFTPASGPVGTSVTISGTNFSTVVGDFAVYFGATRATVNTATSTQLTVLVPAGATYQLISVTKLSVGLTAYSSKAFIVTLATPGTITSIALSPRKDIIVGSTSSSVTGDLDGDGKADLINPTSGEIHVFKNTTSGSGSITFSNKIVFDRTSGEMVLGDIDGDGMLDMIVTNGTTALVSRNTSSGGSINFATEVSYTVGSGSEQAGIADLDADGKPDLIVPNRNSATISVLRNTGVSGSLSFAAKADFATGASPQSVAFGDFDNDGKRDIAVSNYTGQTISVFKNTSSGPGTISFNTKIDYSVGAASPGYIKAADIDGDGKLDLSTNGSSGILIFRNTNTTPGTMSFAAVTTVATGGNSYGLDIGDLNGDGKVDFVTNLPTSNLVALLQNSSTSGSIIVGTAVTFSTGNFPTLGTIINLDNDGRSDVVVSNNSDGTFSIFRNVIGLVSISSVSPNIGNQGTAVNITGTLFSATPSSNVVKFNSTTATVTASTTSSLTTSVPAGATSGALTVTVAGQTATSAFTVLPTSISNFSPQSGAVGTTVTITGTGFDATPSNNFVYFGATRASVSSASTVQLQVTVPAGATCENITVTGTDGLTAYSSRPFVVTFSGGGTIDANSFAPSLSFVTGNEPYSIKIADLDGDGKSDLIETDRTGNTFSVFRNTTSAAGFINYAARVSFTTGQNPTSISLGDLDGDGKKDIIVGLAGGVSIFRNTSTGAGSITFGASLDFSLATVTTSIAIRDLDGDGKPEFVITNGNEYVSVFRNTSTGPGVISFATQVDVAIESGTTTWVSVGDLDGDTKSDLIVGTTASNISVLRNESFPGNLGFGIENNFTTTGQAGSVIAGDLDGDGKVDLAVSTFGTSAGLSLLRNTSTGSGVINFATKVDYSTGLNTFPSSISIGDLDGDNKLDLAVVYGVFNITPTLLAVFRNNSSGAGSIAFNSKFEITTGRYPRSIAIGDLDNDGRPELTATNSLDDDLFVYRNIVGLTSISSFSPTSGIVGTVVTITGTLFNGVPANNLVKFNNVTASATASSTTSITTAIPSGATTGVVTVTTGGQTATSLSNFTVLPTSFTSFSPSSGPVGTVVTIVGTGFSSTPTANVVYFGATRATVNTANPTQLQVIVPYGATYQPIAVTVNQFAVYSKEPFVVTFPNGGLIDATTSFASRINFTTTSAPAATASGDLDGDGKPDIASASLSGSTISVFRNASSSTGSISFAPKTDLSSVSNLNSICIADINGDGKPDIIVSNYTAASFSVFRNISSGVGNISFDTRIDVNIGSGNVAGIAVGDLDGDGKLDLAFSRGATYATIVRNSTSSPASITFDGSMNITIGASTGSSIAIGDLDGDKKPDLITLNGSSSISTLRNISGGVGDIAFATKLDLTCTQPSRVDVADFDADGKLDVLAIQNGSAPSIWRNTSTGSGSISFATRQDLSGVNPTNHSGVGDLDGDGKPDIAAVVAGTSNSFYMFKNASSVGSISFSARVDVSTGTGPQNINIVDLDADGRSDVVTANSSNTNFSVHRNIIGIPTITSVSPGLGVTGQQVVITGTFFDATTGNNTIKFNGTTAVGTSGSRTSLTTSVPVGATSGAITTQVGTETATSPGSFTVLPTPPVISGFSPVSGSIGSSITITGSGFSSTPANNVVFFGGVKASVGAATTTQLTVTIPSGATYQPVSVNVGGLTAFSKAPFKVTFTSGGTIDASSFAPKIDFAGGNRPASVAVADLDGDGKNDLATANDLGNTVSVYRNTSTSGILTFTAKTDYATGSTPVNIAVGDLDGDAKPDLVVTNFNGNTVSVLRNTSSIGTLSFAARIDYLTGNGPTIVAIGDLDNDGHPDLSIGNLNSTNASILRNTSTSPGTISFASKIDFATGNAQGLCVGDVDGDNKPDLVVSLETGPTATVFRNAGYPGTITFDTGVNYTIGSKSRGAALADLDGDGKPELVVTNFDVQTISVFRNISAGPGFIDYAPKTDYSTLSTPYSVMVSDLNGDNKPDLVVTYSTGGKASVFRNTSSGSGNINHAASIDFTVGGAAYSTGSGLADLDGDGKTDLVTPNLNANSVAALRNIIGHPVTPTLNAVSAIAQTTFQLSWPTASGATSYLLDLSSDNFNSFIAGYNSKSISIFSEPVTGLIPATSYQVRLRGVNAFGTSEYSSTVSALTRPADPVAAAATSATQTSFTANWGSVSGASNYRLDVSEFNDFSVLLSGYNDLSVGVAGASVTGLSNGKTYYYRVRSENSTGQSLNSGTISQLTIPATPTATAAGAVGQTSFNATWNSVTGADNYRIDVSLVSNFSSFVSGFNSTSAAGTNISVTGLATGTTYYYRIRSQNAAGQSPDSNTISQITIPATPTTNAATTVTQSSFIANWGTVTGASNYFIDVSTDGFNSYLTGYNGKSVSTNNEPVTGLNPATTYQYRVRSNNAGGTSSSSNTTSTLSIPATPTATSAGSVAQTSFTANWNSVTGADNYRIDVSLVNNFSSFVSGYNSTSVAGTSTSVTGLATGTTYYYRVRSENATGQSPNSNTITQITIPATPVTTTATIVTQTSFTTNWGAVTGAANYFIDVSTDGFTTYLTGYNGKSVATNSEPLTGLSPATTYQYRVRSNNAPGTSSNSNTISQLTIPATPTATTASSIAQTSFTANWNPVTGADNYRIDVSLVNTFSSFVSGYNSTSVTGTSTSVSGLASGTTYYYRLRSENATGQSPSSNTISQITIPATPTTTTAVSIAQTSFTATWGAVTGAANYFIDVSTDGFNSYLAGYNGKSVTTNNEALTGLSPATTYQYRVRSSNAAGTSGNSNTTSTLSITATPTATGASSVTQTSFIANWNSVPAPDNYRIDVSSSINFSSFVSGYASALVQGTSTSVIGLAAGTTYYYRLRSQNATGQSPNSNAISQITIPTTPVTTTATTISQTSLTANWDGITAGADNFRLDLSTDNFNSFVAGYEDKSMGNVGSATISGLDGGINYQYRVRASNAGGVSVSSNTTNALTIPSTPALLTPTAIGSSSFTLNWSTIVGADNLFIDVSSDSFSNFTVGYNNLSVSGSLISFTANNLSHSTTYQVRMRSKNATGTSPNSAILVVNTSSVEPIAQPTAITFSSVTPNSMSGSFLAAVGAPTGYLVLYRTLVSPSDVPTDGTVYTGGNIGSSTIAYVGSATSFSLPGLNPDTEYFFDVFAYNGSSNAINYLTTAPLEGNRKTLTPEPGAQPSGLNFTSVTTSSISVSFDNAVGLAAGYLVLYKTVSSPLDVPVDGVQYTSGSIGNSSIAYSGNANSFTLTGLSPATSYYFDVFSFNGTTSTYNYLTSLPLEGSQTTLAVEPLSPPSTLTFNSTAPTSLSISFAPASGSPAGYLVLYKTTSSPADTPLDGTVYSGGNIGASTIAYIGGGTSFSLSALSPETEYFFDVFAYNGSGNSINYLAAAPLEGNRKTLAPEPAAQPTSISFSGATATSVSVAFTGAAGSPAGYLVLYKATQSPTDIPLDGVQYTSGSLGNSLIAYSGSATSFTVSGLSASTVYHFDVFAFNGASSTYNYLSNSPLEGSQTTLAVEPSNPPSLLNFTAFTTNSLSLSFAAATGSPTGYLVIYKAALSPTDIPGDGTVYSGTVGGSIIASFGNATSLTVSGLDAQTEYFFDVFAYNGSAGNINYLTGGSAKGSRTTLAPSPSAPPTGLTFSPVTSSSITGTFIAAPGSPAGYIVLAKAGSAPPDVPADGTTYTAGTSFNSSTIVAVGNSTTFNHIALVAATEYHYSVYAYNGSSQAINYLETSPLTNKQTTPAVSKPPKINTPASSSSLPSGIGSMKITVNVTDGVGARTVSLKYRGVISTEAHNSKPALLKSGDDYEVEITEAMMDDLGTEYFFEATDQNNDKAVQAEKSYLYKSVSATSANSIIPKFSGFNGKSLTYRMISIPYVLDEKSFEDIFSALGSYNKEKWRIFHYDNPSDSYKEYNEGLSANVEMGLGYWFNASADPTEPINVGNGKVFSANQVSAFSMPVKEGWNQIGNPYPFNIDWSAIKTANAAVGLNSLNVWEDRKWDKTGVLAAWNGAFVYADHAGEVVFPVTSRTTARIKPQSELPVSIDEVVWSLPLTLSFEGMTQTSAIGMHPEADQSKDKFDDITMPRFIDYLEMNTNHPEYRAHRFSSDVVPTSPHRAWEFTLTSNLDSGPAALSWEVDAISKSQSQIYLIDMTDQLWIDMKVVGEYSFRWKDNRKIKVVYARNGDVDPGLTIVGNAYPNPFADRVTIPVLVGSDNLDVQVDIFDLMGRKVKMLSAHFPGPGAHELHWDGNDDYGQDATRGVLIYRLNNHVQAKRMIKR